MFYKQFSRTVIVRGYATFAAGLTFALAASPASAHHHRHDIQASLSSKTASHTYSWEKGGVDLSPVSIDAYANPNVGVSTSRANFLRKMHLENGAKSRGTHYITMADIRSRDLFILQITQSLEGGFDSVNMYDRGILSWGLMQWTAWTGSLPRALQYMKTRLAMTDRQRIWDKVFVANGLDVDGDRLIVYGKPLNNEQDMRLAFRGTIKPGLYDPKLVNHWVTTMARAGRQSDIAQLEIEYAAHVVDGVLLSRIDLPYHSPGRAGVTPADLAGNDPYAEALIFALWTNNPRHAIEYVEDAARAARNVSVSDDPALWTPGAFSSALLRKCHASRFGNWQARAAMIEERAALVHTAPASALGPFEQQYQTVLATRKARRMMELASRHQEMVRLKMAKLAKLHRAPASTRVASKAKPAYAHRFEVAKAPARKLPVLGPFVKPMPVVMTATHPAPAGPPMPMPVDPVRKLPVVRPLVTKPLPVTASSHPAPAEPPVSMPADPITVAVANLEKSMSAASAAIARRQNSASGSRVGTPWRSAASGSATAIVKPQTPPTAPPVSIDPASVAAPVAASPQP